MATVHGVGHGAEDVRPNPASSMQSDTGASDMGSVGQRIGMTVPSPPFLKSLIFQDLGPLLALVADNAKMNSSPELCLSCACMHMCVCVYVCVGTFRDLTPLCFNSQTTMYSMAGMIVARMITGNQGTGMTMTTLTHTAQETSPPSGERALAREAGSNHDHHRMQQKSYRYTRANSQFARC